MLQAEAVVNLINAIVPLYICIIFGYVTTRLRILPHETNYVGIAGFTSKFAVPFLLFRLVAANNPYTMNLKLIASDVLFKVTVLAALGVNCFFRPTHQYLAWVCTLFSLAAIPNSALLGPPLVTALYPGTAPLVTTLIFMQSCIWFSICILLLELHKAVLENSKDYMPDSLPRFGSDIDIEGKAHDDSQKCVSEEKSYSGKHLSDDVYPDQPGMPLPVFELAKWQQQGLANGLPVHVPQEAESGMESYQSTPTKHAKDAVEARKLTKTQVAGKVLRTVLYQFIWAPVVWANILGFTYAIFNFRYNHGRPLPKSLETVVDYLASSATGIAMFLLGMNMGVSPKLFAGGVYKALFGAGIRFIVAPACMALCSFAIGLRGNVFRFAVTQSMLPQAILSFVFHYLYNVHSDVFSTAVWFQTAIFVPFALVLELLLSL